MSSDADQFPGLATELLADEEMVVAERRSTKQVRRYCRIDELVARPLVLSDMLASIVSRHLHEVGADFNYEVEMDSVQAIKTMVLRGEAATILPVSMLAEEIAAGLVEARSIGRGGTRRQLVLAQAAFRQMSHATEALKRTVQAVVADMTKEGLFTLEGCARRALANNGHRQSGWPSSNLRQGLVRSTGRRRWRR